jgi:hypothetical protein
LEQFLAQQIRLGVSFRCDPESVWSVRATHLEGDTLSSFVFDITAFGMTQLGALYYEHNRQSMHQMLVTCKLNDDGIGSVDKTDKALTN